MAISSPKFRKLGNPMRQKKLYGRIASAESEGVRPRLVLQSQHLGINTRLALTQPMPSDSTLSFERSYTGLLRLLRLNVGEVVRRSRDATEDVA